MGDMLRDNTHPACATAILLFAGTLLAPPCTAHTGRASYYNLPGRRTASGQRFNSNALTCAHRTLPFGTRLNVTAAGRSVQVRVNDRGPFVQGRVIDLTPTAFKRLAQLSCGTVSVAWEVAPEPTVHLDPPSAPATFSALLREAIHRWMMLLADPATGITATRDVICWPDCTSAPAPSCSTASTPTHG